MKRREAGQVGKRRHLFNPAALRCALHLGVGWLLIVLCACIGERRPPEPVVDAPPESPAASESSVRPTSLIAEIPPEIAPNRPRAATRLLTYPRIPAADRGDETITVVDDLVIEERPGERRYDFDDAADVVTDTAGRIYVHDRNHYRVVAYEPDGSFARQYGNLHDAPFHLGWIAWSGERLVMSTGTKVTVFAPGGEHLFDRPLVSYAFRRDVRGTSDGSLVGAFSGRDQEYRSWYSVEKRSLDDDAAFTYWAVRVPERGSSRPPAQPGFAATRAGEVYMTRGDEYAVQAFAADGTARWLLLVAPPTGTAAPTAEPGPPALSVPAGGSPGVGHPLRVDGHGNLYVFPYVAAADERGRVPVDVYSPSGERLFAGWIERHSWLEANGDFVYGIEQQDDAQRIVRYRLRAPFLSATPAERDP